MPPRAAGAASRRPGARRSRREAGPAAERDEGAARGQREAERDHGGRRPGRAGRRRGRRVTTAPAQDGFETRAIHAGQDPDAVTGAVIPPISLATTFAQDAVGQHRGFEYARSGNPPGPRSRRAWPRWKGPATAWPSPAVWPPRTPSCGYSRPGDHLVIPDDAYGGTFRLIDKVWGPLGIAHTPVPLHDPTPSSPPGGRKPAWSGWRRPPTRGSPSSTSPPSRRWPTSGAPDWWSTTPSPPRTSSSR